MSTELHRAIKGHDLDTLARLLAAGHDPNELHAGWAPFTTPLLKLVEDPPLAGLHACTIKWSCSDTSEKLGTKYEKLLTCPELLARIPIGKACIAERKLIQSECFAGSPEPGHEEIMEGLTKGLSQCMRKAATRGPGGGPC